MLKRLGLFSIISLWFLSSVHAKSGISGQQPSLKDTADVQIKDSVKQQIKAPPIDPKEEFKNLFNESPENANVFGIERLNPLALSFVENYIAKTGKKTEAIKGWGKPYFDVMDAVLSRHKLPKELKYLAIVESELKVHARSRVGAVGPWQLMPSTARGLGLKINRHIDERKDVYKSTQAASRYLKSLFSIYGDWLLVLAAYNGGPGKVNTAIKKSGSRDYWELQKYLPAESRKHVKKYIAIHYIMEGGGGSTTFTKFENEKYQADLTIDTLNVEVRQHIALVISGRYIASVIARHIEMNITVFNQINPNFDKDIAFNGKYELRLPSEKMDIFTAKKTEILSESMQLLLHAETVAAGTL